MIEEGNHKWTIQESKTEKLVT